jgi:peptidoglycan hydrolase-like protein with peptidoglycan-binding domain
MAIVAPVGPQRPNRAADVRTVQMLLNRAGSSGATPLRVDGVFGPRTADAITHYQTRSLRLSRPDGVVDPNGPTLNRLGRDHRGNTTPTRPVPRQPTRAPAPAASPSRTAPAAAPQGTGPGGLSEATYVDMAARLQCETSAIEAIVETEVAIRGPFDAQGRPTILYERHKFHKHTGGRYDAAHPDLSSPKNSIYGKYSEQYSKLERAMKLNSSAALQSASWGAFQILGENHVQAGHPTVDSFVAAMKSGILGQTEAFVALFLPTADCWLRCVNEIGQRLLESTMAQNTRTTIMTARCARTINGSPMRARVLSLKGSLGLAAACAVGACSAEPSVATSNTVGTVQNTSVVASTAVAVPSAASASASQELKLAGQADGAAVAATLAEAQRQQMTDITISKSQSFRVVNGTKQVATVLTGEGKMPDATNAGCFIAIQQGDDVALIPTLGYGNYDADTCGGPLAVGIVSANPVRFGIVFRSYSRDAEITAPMVVEWDRSDNTLLIDDALSTKVVNAGAGSISVIRGLIGRP